MRVVNRLSYVFLLVIFLTTAVALAQQKASIWTPVQQSAKQLHGTYTRMKDGTVIATGTVGVNQHEPTARSVEIFDPATDSWSEGTPMNHPRGFHDAFLLPDGRLLVIGGVKYNGFSPLTVYAGPPEIYDPATKKWTVINVTGADLSGRYAIIPPAIHAMLPDGKILGMVRFGTGVSSFTFDPRTGEAQNGAGYAIQGKGIQGEDEALRLFDGKVMVPVGDNSVIFDPATYRWQALPQAIATNGTTTLEPRLAAVLNDGTAFAFFKPSVNVGSSGSRTFCGRYDPKTNTWINVYEASPITPLGRLNKLEALAMADGTRVFVLDAENRLAAIYDGIIGTLIQSSMPPQTVGSLATPVLLADGRILAGNGIYGTVDGPPATVPRLTTASSASYAVTEVAQGSLASAFGVGISDSLPVELTDKFGNRTTFKINSAARNSGQVNFAIPNDIPEGTGEVAIGEHRGRLSITRVSPGVFSANADGRGVPAAVVLRVKTDGSQVYESIARFDSSAGRFVPVEIDLSSGEQVYLILFGTGWRNGKSASVFIGGTRAEVSYAGAQGSFFGLDQMNVLLPPSLANSGKTLDLLVTVDGKLANALEILVK